MKKMDPVLKMHLCMWILICLFLLYIFPLLSTPEYISGRGCADEQKPFTFVRLCPEVSDICTFFCPPCTFFGTQDNADKLDIPGADRKKMAEYRAQLDAEREEALAKGRNRPKRKVGIVNESILDWF